MTQLEKQLPGKAEMDALLSDINQAGLGRGLQFELFRPGQVEVKDYYAELPIAIRVSGRYHDIGAFAADVANLSRIVTLHNLSIAPAVGRATPAAMLAMDATARTYRYLDATEVAEQTQGGRGQGGQGRGSEEMTRRPVHAAAALAALLLALLAGCGAEQRGAAGMDGAAAPRGQAQRAAAVSRRRSSTPSPTARRRRSSRSAPRS